MEVDATVAFTLPGCAGGGPLFSRLWTCGGPGDSFVRYRPLCIDTTSSITALNLNAQRSSISFKRSLPCHIVSGSQWTCLYRRRARLVASHGIARQELASACESNWRHSI